MQTLQEYFDNTLTIGGTFNFLEKFIYSNLIKKGLPLTEKNVEEEYLRSQPPHKRVYFIFLTSSGKLEMDDIWIPTPNSINNPFSASNPVVEWISEIDPDIDMRNVNFYVVNKPFKRFRKIPTKELPSYLYNSNKILYLYGDIEGSDPNTRATMRKCTKELWESFPPFEKSIISEEDDIPIVHICETCKTDLDNPKFCSDCQVVAYCDNMCQKADWKRHKTVCRLLHD